MCVQERSRLVRLLSTAASNMRKCSFKLLAWRVPMWWKEAEELDVAYFHKTFTTQSWLHQCYGRSPWHSLIQLPEISSCPKTLTWRLSVLILVLTIELGKLVISGWSIRVQYGGLHVDWVTVIDKEGSDHPGGDFRYIKKNLCVQTTD